MGLFAPPLSYAQSRQVMGPGRPQVLEGRNIVSCQHEHEPLAINRDIMAGLRSWYGSSIGCPARFAMS